MKKSWKKAKRIMLLAILTIISFPRKIFADTNESIVSDISTDVCLYGVPGNYYVIPCILKLVKVVIIPIALAIGMIIYLKKSKSGKKKKIIISLIVIAITVLVYFVGDIIISAYFM